MIKATTLLILESEEDTEWIGESSLLSENVEYNAAQLLIAQAYDQSRLTIT